jgi:hypothetical protein
MAALNFPSSPTLGQQYAGTNGVTYTWDGETWTVAGPTGTRAIVERNVAQSITSGVQTAIIFDTEVVDVGGLWAPGSPDRFTIPAAGVYLIGGHMVFAGHATGNARLAGIALNTVPNLYSYVQIPASTASFTPAFSVSVMLSLAAGNVVFLSVGQDSGTVLSTSSYSNFWITRLG